MTMQAQPYRAGQPREAGDSLAAMLRGATSTGQNPQDSTRQLAAGAGQTPARASGGAAGPARPAAPTPPGPEPLPATPGLSDALKGVGQALGYPAPPYLAQLLAARH